MGRRRAVVLRLDADERIGLGHAARALALGEALGAALGARPTVLARPSAVLDRFLAGRLVDRAEIRGSGYAAAETLAATAPGTVLVSDSYDLDADDLERLAGGSALHVVIDDEGALPRYPCDVVVNPNLGAATAPYRSAGCVLAGPRYALLRAEARALAARPGRPATEPRVVVAFGGGRWAPGAIRLLAALGGLARDGATVLAPAADPPPGVMAIAPASLLDALHGADLAVLAGGVTKYEAAALGVPMLLCAVVAHQRAGVAAVAAAGAACDLGDADAARTDDVVRRARDLLADAPARARMAAAGRALVDGRGADRVTEAVLRVVQAA